MRFKNTTRRSPTIHMWCRMYFPHWTAPAGPCHPHFVFLALSLSSLPRLIRLKCICDLRDLDVWLMTLTFELDLDILPLDLHAKIQVRVSVCVTARVVTHTHTQTDRRCQNYYTRRVASLTRGVMTHLRTWSRYYLEASVYSERWFCVGNFLNYLTNSHFLGQIGQKIGQDGSSANLI